VHGVDIILPGGLPLNGSIERSARFRPLTGRIEQALAELVLGPNRPGDVTAVLGAALDSIGSQPADTGQVADLCVADRQYLMLRLSAMIEGEQMWLKVSCAHCGAPFDVDIRRCDLPVKPAGPGFPQITVRLNGWTMDVRVPTGADQEVVGGHPEEEALRLLLERCICSVNGEPAKTDVVDRLSESDIRAIDLALDDASPAVCDQLLVSCPECGQDQYAQLDHYSLVGLNGTDVYDEVHTLASHYHWSEASILDLPRDKRRRYLGMIHRATGMYASGGAP